MHNHTIIKVNYYAIHDLYIQCIKLCFCRTNTESPKVEIQHIKHSDVATMKKIKALDDNNIDGDENIYETVSDEVPHVRHMVP